MQNTDIDNCNSQYSVQNFIELLLLCSLSELETIAQLLKVSTKVDSKLNSFSDNPVKNSNSILTFMANNYGLVRYYITDKDPLLLQTALQNKNNLYIAIPLALGGIYTPAPLYDSYLENLVFVLDDNYITNTNDTIMAFNTSGTSSYSPISGDKLSGIMYMDEPTYNDTIGSTDIYKGISITGYDRDLTPINIG